MKKFIFEKALGKRKALKKFGMEKVNLGRAVFDSEFAKKFIYGRYKFVWREEIDEILSKVKYNEDILIYGPSGIGKTTVLLFLEYYFNENMRNAVYLKGNTVRRLLDEIYKKCNVKIKNVREGIEKLKEVSYEILLIDDVDNIRSNYLLKELTSSFLVIASSKKEVKVNLFPVRIELKKIDKEKSRELVNYYFEKIKLSRRMKEEIIRNSKGNIGRLMKNCKTIKIALLSNELKEGVRIMKKRKVNFGKKVFKIAIASSYLLLSIRLFLYSTESWKEAFVIGAVAYMLISLTKLIERD